MKIITSNNLIIKRFAKVSVATIIFTILLSYSANAQVPQDTYPHQEPIQPENYLYLPSFKSYGLGLDFQVPGASIIASPGILATCFDSTNILPLEAIAQNFMIDSAITIYGVALYRHMIAYNSLESYHYEDSIQIRSIDLDTIYRSISIAHLRKPDCLEGVYEYNFDSLTLSTPFAVVRIFAREHYRRKTLAEDFAMCATMTPGSPANPYPPCHSFQRPRVKHYGDSLWYDTRECPHKYVEHCPWSLSPAMHTIYYRYTDSLYTDLYMLPIYAKAPEPIYNVSVSAEPENYGTVLGSGDYAKHTYITIEAIPDENCRFVCWENIPLCDNPLTIRVMSDTTFVAIFDTILPNAIDMAEIEETITIRPNPVTTTLNIELPQSCTAELRNIKGILIETKQLQGKATQWNIETLPPGVYMLTFRNNDWVITRKFLKK